MDKLKEKQRNETKKEQIDLLEQNACLWEVLSKKHHLSDKRDKAYETMQEELEIPITGVKIQDL